MKTSSGRTGLEGEECGRPIGRWSGSRYSFPYRTVSSALACWSLALVGGNNIISHPGYLPFCSIISLSSSQLRPTSSVEQ